MKIFAIGSIADIEDSKKDDAKEYCRDLGRAIISQGHQLLICSASKNTIDPYIVEGAKQTTKSGKIILFRPDKETRQEDEDYDTGVYFSDSDTAIKFTQKEITGGWRVVHLKALHDADIVIAIGGRDLGTGTVVYSAELLEKPIILIRHFKGSTEKAWRDLSRYYDNRIKSELYESTPDIPPKPDKVLEIAKALKKKNPFRLERKKRTNISIFVGLVSFFTWFYVLIEPITLIPLLVNLALLLILSSIFGSSIRYALYSRGYISVIWFSSKFFETILLGILLSCGVVFFVYIMGHLMTSSEGLAKGLNFGKAGLSISILSTGSSIFIEQAWMTISRKAIDSSK